MGPEPVAPQSPARRVPAPELPPGEATAPPIDDGALDLGDLRLDPGAVIGRYTLLRRVASGGMAHVALVRGPDGREVALKVLKSSRKDTGELRFRREFRALSRLRHENIIRVDDYGDVSGHPYFAMEYVEGRDLHSEIRSWKQITPAERWARVEDSLADICRALAYIHRKGLVHRDLKPSNILLDAQGRCKLTDFGIVKELDPEGDAFVSTTLVGTWAYASPEQLTGAPIDHRGDLYSLGVILYAMLTGRRPFAAKDMAGWLAAHRDVDPVPPSAMIPGVPGHLNEICLRLLRKKPRDRPQSAHEVLLALQRAEAAPLDGLITDEREWEPPLVGRAFERELLHDAVSALTRGQGGVLLIEGPGGVGRTRLFRLALQQARQIGIPVHAARMTASEGAFGALLRVAEDIGKELGAGVPTELNQAIAAFEGGKGRVAGDLRYRLFDGVRLALDKLLAEGPNIVALDDLHHAPAPITALLGFLARTLIARDKLPLLILGTARTDLPTPNLRGLRDGAELGQPPLRLELGPLSPGEVHELCAAVLGEAAPVAGSAEALRLYDETGGAPLLLTEALRARREGAARAAQGGGDELDELGEDAATEVGDVDAQLPAAVRAAVARRLAGATPQERAMLEALAVHGAELELEVLLDVVGAGDEEEALDRVDGLVDRGLLLERHLSLQVFHQLAQQRIADVLYRDMPSSRRASWHLGLGRALAARGAPTPALAEAIGEHLRRGGDGAEAWRFLVKAAVGLWERSLLAEAEALAERARPLEREAPRALDASDYGAARLGILQVRGAIAYNRGRWNDAHQAMLALRGAALASGDDRLAGRAGLDLGSVLRRLGHTEEAEAVVQSVLGGAEAQGDDATACDALHRLAVFAWESGDLDACQRLASEALARADGPDRRQSRAQVLIALAAVQASRGLIGAATRGLEEAGGLHAELRNKRSGAVVMGNLAELLVWQGEYGAALERAEAGLELARDALFREGEAFLLRVRASARFHAGLLDEADADLLASLAIGEELGVSADLVAARFARGRLALRRGQVEAAVEQLRGGLRAAHEADPERYGPTLRATLAHARCLQGETADAEVLLGEVQAELGGLHLPRRTQVLLVMGEAWTAMGQLDAALTCARQAALVASSRGLRTWALRARALMSQIAPPDEADEAARDAARLAQQLAAELPPALSARFRAQPTIAGLWMHLDEVDDLELDDPES